MNARAALEQYADKVLSLLDEMDATAASDHAQMMKSCDALDEAIDGTLADTTDAMEHAP